MYSSAKVKKKKLCKYCNKFFYKSDKYNDTQWKDAKYCSRKCFADLRRKHATKALKSEAWRRRQGMLIKGTEEYKQKISETTKLAMQRPEVQTKIRQPKGPMPEWRKAQQSDKLKGKMPANLMYANTAYPNIKRGWYDINGTSIFFRSKWEANYALYLDFLIDNKLIVKWEFEPDTFIFEEIKFGTRSYTPDFKIFNNDKSIIYHEIKGYMDSKSKTKLKRMNKYYPDIKVIVIGTDEYNVLKRQVGAICKFY